MSDVDPIEAVERASATFNVIVDGVESRCMAVDGPVTPTLDEMSERELRKLWQQVQKIRAALPALVALREKRDGEERRADRHARINESVAKALGQEFGETWHDLGAKVAALRARVRELEEHLGRWPSLECPCCGEEAAFAEFFEDGQPTTCGCGGQVMADGEGAHISVFECENPKCADDDETRAASRGAQP